MSEWGYALRGLGRFVRAGLTGKWQECRRIADDGVQRLGGKLTKQAIHGVVHAANHPQIGRALVKHHSAYWAA